MIDTLGKLSTEYRKARREDRKIAESEEVAALKHNVRYHRERAQERKKRLYA